MIISKTNNYENINKKHRNYKKDLKMSNKIISVLFSREGKIMTKITISLSRQIFLITIF